MPYIEMKLDWQQKLSDLALATVCRRPVRVSHVGRGRILQLEFDPELDATERTDLLNAMPEFLNMIYTFEVKSGTLGSG